MGQVGSNSICDVCDIAFGTCVTIIFTPNHIF